MQLENNLQNLDKLSPEISREINSAAADEKVARIKILIIAPTLDVFLGGQAVQAARLLEKLNEEPNIQADIQTIGPQFLSKLQQIKYLRTFLRQIKYWFDILTKIPKYDIIHICSSAHLSFLLTPTPAVLVAKLFGKKTVLNYRSGQFEEHYKNWHKTLSPTLNLFDRIVTPSNYLVDVFARHGFEAQSVHNFLDLEKFYYRERKKLRPIFLSNRLLEDLYNIPCIFRAFGIVQKKYPEAKLIVAGFGYLRGELEKSVNEMKLQNVEFVGKIEQKEMFKLYDKVDIYVNSPNTDNMPGSIIESFASGVPIVTTNAGGIPYILEHEKTGLMVEVNDHEQMAREALRLLEDENLVEKLTKNGREYVKNFSWKEVRGEWLKIYEDLMSEKQL